MKMRNDITFNPKSYVRKYVDGSPINPTAIAVITTNKINTAFALSAFFKVVLYLYFCNLDFDCFVDYNFSWSFRINYYYLE